MQMRYIKVTPHLGVALMSTDKVGYNLPMVGKAIFQWVENGLSFVLLLSTLFFSFPILNTGLCAIILWDKIKGSKSKGNYIIR